MRRIWLQFLLAMSMLIMSLSLYLSSPPLLQTFELRLVDQMLVFRGEQPVDPDIVIVDIDERSLHQLGQWPWSRDLVAELLDQLTLSGIGMIGLDVVFAEPDRSSPRRILAALGMEVGNAPDFDEQLIQTIVNTPTVSGYVFAMEPDGLPPGLSPEPPPMIVEYRKPPDSLLMKPYRTILSIQQHQEPTLFSGYINTLPDIDGTIRHLPLVMEYEQMIYPALALEMARLALGKARIMISYDGPLVEGISLDDYHLSTDMHGRLRINFRGAARHYPYLSAVDLLEGRVPDSALEGKMALIGTSAAGLLDLRSTPLDSVYPGVEVHATVLDNLLNGDFLVTPAWATGADIVLLVVLAALMWGFLILPGSAAGSLLSLILLIGVALFHYYLIVFQGLVLNLLLPLAMIAALFLLGSVLNFVLEQRQKEKIIRRFERKVSHDVVEQLLRSDALILEGTEQEVTVFFSDIRGFTALSEKIGSAKALILLLNRYMTPMTGIITAHKGTVDKFIGDAIMAYWNAPLPDQKHADQALQAAIEQIMALEELNQAFQSEGLPCLQIGIGLNTGLAVVGEMGSADRSDYTCIGDEVNLASRTEGLCKLFGANIVLTDSTRQALLQPDLYRLRCLGQSSQGTGATGCRL
ncbi:CHASE2 domain-containing protein [Nitrincola sp. MINF-07-Sa-05]|uniref:CHASE2 domain-containing protein n=1 Tax=Nitrincola salilacus TaxID=3400273 RepID=UPI00391854FC